MPYKNIEINPVKYTEDFTYKTQQIYKGFSTIDPSNKSSKLYDYDLIKQDILNHFNTRRGSRVMNPEFGSIIQEILMEPLTTENRQLIVQDITRICNSDPRVYPLEINVNEYDQGYLIELVLMLKDTNETKVLKIAFDQKIGIQPL
jgi:phage baseplate assembly protein W